MEGCYRVYEQIRSHWAETGRLEYVVLSREPLEGRTFEELGRMRFSVGVGESRTEMPMIEMIVVFDLLGSFAKQRDALEAAMKSRGKGKITLQAKTSFTEQEVDGFLQQIAIKVIDEP